MTAAKNLFDCAKPILRNHITMEMLKTRMPLSSLWDLHAPDLQAAVTNEKLDAALNRNLFTPLTGRTTMPGTMIPNLQGIQRYIDFNYLSPYEPYETVEPLIPRSCDTIYRQLNLYNKTHAMHPAKQRHAEHLFNTFNPSLQKHYSLAFQSIYVTFNAAVLFRNLPAINDQIMMHNAFTPRVKHVFQRQFRFLNYMLSEV